MRSPALAKQSRINIRTTKKQKDLIERGARARGQNVTEFVISSAAEKAEQVLADQREFLLSPAKWNAFTVALDRPPARSKRLAKLMSEASILER